MNVALAIPMHGESAPRGELHAWAGSTFAAGTPVVPATSVERREVNADGRRHIVASFQVADLRAAGLFNPGTTRLCVRIATRDGATLAGSDRLFDQDAFLVMLPPPIGKEGVGTTSHVLFDKNRSGPTAEGRELVLRLWYPAATGERQPAPYFLNDLEAELNALSLQLPGNLFDGIHAFSVRDARPARAGRIPALVLSTGLGSSLTYYSEIAEDLASHGYVVVGVEHPVGSGIVVYPDGTVSAVDPTTFPLDELNRDWAKDLELVAGWLSRNNRRSVSPDPAVRAALALVDTARLGVFGHSFGGAAAVWAASESPLLRASVNVDGRFFGDMLLRAPSTPVLIVLSEPHTPELDPTIGQFIGHTGGPLYTARVAGAGHNNFSDVGTLFQALAVIDPRVSPDQFSLGVIDPARALAIESAYLRAFFGAALSQQPSPLLNGPSPDFPEVTLGSPRAAGVGALR